MFKTLFILKKGNQLHSARCAHQLGGKRKVQSEITDEQSNGFVFVELQTTTPHNFKTQCYIGHCSKQLALNTLVLLVY